MSRNVPHEHPAPGGSDNPARPTHGHRIYELDNQSATRTVPSAESAGTTATQPLVVRRPDLPDETPARAEPRGLLPLIAFLVTWCLVTAAVLHLRWTDPGLTHGDPTTDANILNAGANFDRCGLWESYGLPAIDTFAAPPAADGTSSTSRDWYFTYPPGAYWIHQAWKTVGLTDLRGQRAASIGCWSFGVLLWFAVFLRLSGSLGAASLAGLIYVLSKPALELADNLHYPSISQPVLAVTLLAWLALERAESRHARAAWFAALAAVFAAGCWLTFEHTLFVALFVVVRAATSRSPRLLLSAAALGLVPIILLAFRLLCAARLLGSFEQAFGVFTSKLAQRSGSAVHAASPSSAWTDAASTLVNRLGGGWIATPSGPIWRLPTPASPDSEFMLALLRPEVLAPAMLAGAVLAATWHTARTLGARRLLGAGLLLLIGGLTWFAAMREHAVVHRFTVLLLVPGTAALLGSAAWAAWSQIAVRERSAPIRRFGPAVTIVLLVAWCWQLRSSFLVNSRWPFSGPVARATEVRREQARVLEAARPAFARVSHLRMFSHFAPLPRALDVAFRNAPGDASPLAPGQVLHVYWPNHRQYVLELAEHFGPPNLLSPPADIHLFFGLPRASGTSPDAWRNCDLRAADGLRITGLAVRTPLDTAAVASTDATSSRVLIVRLAGDGLAAGGQSLAIEPFSQEPAQQPAPRHRAPLASACLAPNGGLVWMPVPNQPGHSTLARLVRLSMVKGRAARPVPFATDKPALLPPGVEVRGGSLVIDLDRLAAP